MAIDYGGSGTSADQRAEREQGQLTDDAHQTVDENCEEREQGQPTDDAHRTVDGNCKE